MSMFHLFQLKNAIRGIFSDIFIWECLICPKNSIGGEYYRDEEINGVTFYDKSVMHGELCLID